MLEFREPEELGFDPIKLEQALKLIESHAFNGDSELAYPGAVAMVLCRNSVVAYEAYGYRLLGPNRAPMKKDCIFDMASVTKPVATTSAFLRLLDMGEVKLHEPVGRYLPEFMAPETREITMFHLLTHISGLPSWVPMYKHGNSREEIIRYAFSLRPVHEIGSKVEYSCMGFIILGLALERILGGDLSGFLKEEIFDKLGMVDTGFCPDFKKSDRIVATGKRNQETWEWILENQTSPHGHIYDGIAFGTVHDENAMSLGGISGNAGLFSTAKDLARFATMYLNKGSFEGEQIISQESIALATTNYTAGKGENRGLGWQLKGPDTSSFGNLSSLGSYGHTGFTGTGIWIDPYRELAVILLTNQVHMVEDATNIIKLRPQFIDAVISSFI